MSVRVTLRELNTCPVEWFEQQLGWIFEGSPWVAGQAAGHRPFRSIEELHQAMVNEVTSATREQQLYLLRAHPDLGTRARIAPASAKEQAGVGLDRLTPELHARLTDLNSQYREKFGHPFLFAVRGSSAADILASLERRLPLDPEDEFTEALRQVAQIAKFRLEDFIVMNEN